MGYSPWGCKEWDVAEQLKTHIENDHLCLGEGGQKWEGPEGGDVCVCVCVCVCKTEEVLNTFVKEEL